MSLKEKLQQDLDGALKQRQTATLSTLRVLLASIQNKEKEKRYKISKRETNLGEKELEEKSALSDEEIVDVIVSELKKRKESILAYEQGKREDLAKKEKAEAEILQKYLPEQLSEEELRKIVKEAIEKSGAKEQKDIGKIMTEVMPKVKGKADGSQVSKIVKELLS
jgi:hypothetical protein